METTTTTTTTTARPSVSVTPTIASPGMLRGLQQIAYARGIITVTALDHRGSFKKTLQRAAPDREIGYAEVVAEKLRMVRLFAPHSSAVLLDPVYGAAQAIAAGALAGGGGLIVALEESGYEGGDEARVTPITEGWSVAKIKRLGAAAVKLLLYYHPEGPTARQQEALVMRVAEECRQHDITLLLEPMSYAIKPGQQKESAEFARQKPEIVLESARRLSGLGIDLLKCEFPDDPHFEQDEARMREHCRQLTAASAVPWVILSAAERFGVFQRLVEIACEEGASGFMVGRAIWQEAMALPDAEEREHALRSTALSRLQVLNAIASYRARPWPEHYPALAVAEGWHQRYASLG
ncbi:MAG TPA: tagatose 1,6-diphosphate aldolase [Ktedonobacterales bacterium]|nr:tagatose 1,6-diphosphate aldolase [Ktedonobacterales bacterium]